MHQTVPQAFKEVNAYYGNNLNSALTARLVLHLREAGEENAYTDSLETANSERWEMRVLSKVVDDFEDNDCHTSKLRSTSSRHVRYEFPCSRGE